MYMQIYVSVRKKGQYMMHMLYLKFKINDFQTLL